MVRMQIDTSSIFLEQHHVGIEIEKCVPFASAIPSPNITSFLVNKGRDCVTLAGTPLPDGLHKGPEVPCETTVLAKIEAPPKRRLVEQHDIEEESLAEADGGVPFPLPCIFLQQCGFIIVDTCRQRGWTRQPASLLPGSSAVSPICATHDAFTLAGSTPGRAKRRSCVTCLRTWTSSSRRWSCVTWRSCSCRR